MVQLADRSITDPDIEVGYIIRRRLVEGYRLVVCIRPAFNRC
jgi:hypothetical protein